ncbi:MAG: hypothetical protein ISR45_04120 [Rhodospirillales bacterium]|nr:hypothetical protein [Rhodospirillales bacterium]
MRRFSIYSILALCLSLFLSSNGISVAQGYGEALMNSFSYRPVPMGSSFHVQPLDNSDQNMALKKEFEHVLNARGYSINEDAQLVISFETRNEIGAYKTRNKRAVLELDAHGGREGGEDARMRFNLFDSNSGGVFNQGKGETSVTTPSQYRIDVTIDNRSNGKRHWQAWAAANLEQSDGASLVKAMVPEIVGKIGETVKSHIFEIF